MAGGLFKRKRSDENGCPIPARDRKGRIIYEKDGRGRIRRDESGKPIPVAETYPRYYVWWFDANGRKRERAAYTDKEASQDLLRQLQSEAARGKQGMLDPFAEHRGTPLVEHLAAFIDHLRAGDRADRYVQGMQTMLRRALEEMNAALPKHMTPDRAEAFLTDLVETEGLAHKTRNDHLRALSQFAKWGVIRGRWETNPFKAIAKLNEAVDVRRKRRALSVDELRSLIHAAKNRGRENCVARGLGPTSDRVKWIERKGHERSLIYKTAALTGLREDELRRLEWTSLALDESCPTLTAEAKDAKAKREDTIELNAELAEALREWRDVRNRELGRRVKGGERVFHVPSGILEQFYKDCLFVGIGRKITVTTEDGREVEKISTQDDAGQVVDFHSLRHTYGTFLGRAGIPQRTLQALMRHTTGKMSERYTHAVHVDRVQAVESLPRLDTDAEADSNVCELAMAAGAESLRLPHAEHMQNYRWLPEAQDVGSGQSTPERRKPQIGDSAASAKAMAPSGIPGQSQTGTGIWYPVQDSNLRPLAPEASALFS